MGASMYSTVADAVDAAHRAMWSRMIKDDGIMLDYTDRDGSAVIPSPEECGQSKPNAMGWWTPIENGGFFNGLYLPAVIERYRRTKNETDKAHAKKLASGLMLLASVSDVPGYIARGISTDGKTHYPAGSDDQTHPWFLGLYHYVKSDIPDAAEKAAIIKKMTAVADALKQNRWMSPCDGAFKGQNRGAFSGKGFRDASRLLFILRALYEVTGDDAWLTAYKAAAVEKPWKSDLDRLSICAEGCMRDKEIDIKTQQWIFAGSQASLVELVRLDNDESRCAAYREGIRKTAQFSAGVINMYRDFDNGSEPPFRLLDWRTVLNVNWKPQASMSEATTIALNQLRQVNLIDRTNQIVPRRDRESAQLRDPLAAAYIVAVSGDADIIAQNRQQIEAAIMHYDYPKIYGSLFFFAECAYYALPEK